MMKELCAHSNFQKKYQYYHFQGKDFCSGTVCQFNIEDMIMITIDIFKKTRQQKDKLVFKASALWADAFYK